MTFVCQFTQSIHDTASQSDKCFFSDSQLHGYTVCSLESNTPDIICQAKWVLSHLLDAFIAILTINLSSKGGADPMILQKQHDILDFFLPFPALSDLIDTFLSDSWNFQESLYIGFDNLQCIRAKLLNNLLGKLRPHTFDQTGTKIFFNAKNSGRHGFLPAFCQELSAIFRIYLPIPINQKY